MTIMIVEQKAKEILKLANRAHILRLGKISMKDTANKFIADGKYGELFKMTFIFSLIILG